MYHIYTQVSSNACFPVVEEKLCYKNEKKTSRFSVINLYISAVPHFVPV